MPLIKLWIISVKYKSLLFSREFPINRVKAAKLKLACQQLPTPSVESDQHFLNGVCDALGICLPTTISSSESLDESGLETLPMPVFDFSVSNQIPVVRIQLNAGTSIWPVLIVEHKGLYYCALPLIDNESPQLLDHLSISIAFSSLHSFISWFTKEKASYLLYFAFKTFIFI